MNKFNKRFWEVDFLRGIAIISMITFHFFYDLNYFNIHETDLNSGGFLILMWSTGSIFIFLVGISLTLSYTRAEKILEKKDLKLKFFKRGLMIFGLGLIITALTWFFIGEGFVVFGVLHCIGISIILAYPFLRFHYLNLLIGIVLIAIGITLRGLSFDFYYLIWLGFKTSNFFTLDYYPLLPWFGVVLVGIFLGKVLYQNNKRTLKLKDLSSLKSVSLFCYLGRHSLIIYFLHHIVLLSIVYMLLNF